MFWYNLKIALRNILKNRGFSVINLVGLSIGMACSLLILLMAHFVWITDRFHDNFENIFLLQQKLLLSSGDVPVDRVGGSMGPAIAETYPQVQYYTRYGQPGEMLLSYKPDNSYSVYTETRSFIEEDGIAADSLFFNVFSFAFKQGDPASTLQNDNYLILTETLADKLFPNKDGFGKTVYINEGMPLTVTGILYDLPYNSSVQFSYIAPFRVMELIGFPIEGFGGTNFFTYFVLDNPGSAEIINADINDFLDTKMPEDLNLKTDRYLTHVRYAFLFGEQMNFIGILVFGILGFGILLIACLNYINLSTAKSMDRTREVGIRKTGGASRWQLTRQFLGESLILTIIAVHFAVLLVELGLPKINSISESPMHINYADPVFYILILSIVIIVGLLAGSYPALHLSSLNPSLILKDYSSTGKKGNRLRKVLVVSQFSITIFFILCTFFLYKQLDHIYTADPGFNKENVIYFPTRGAMWDKYEEIRTELLQETHIDLVSSASSLPTNADRGEINWGKEKGVQNTLARIIHVDHDFTKTFEMNLVNGRFFSREHPSDIKNGIVVNEEIVRILEYEGDPIGQRFQLWETEYNIIGVVEDFAFFPIDIGGKGLIMRYSETNDFIFLKVNDGFNTANLSRIQAILKKHNPEYPFEYYYMSKYESPIFEDIKNQVGILYYFCGFGVFISCLGLFGLALFTVEKKTKEIGIRKVFGASVYRIVTMLSKEFIALVIAANIIAIPLAYLALKGILKFFLMKISLDVSIFILIGIGMVLIAFLTVLWQSLSTARKNPVTSLRYE